MIEATNRPDDSFRARLAELNASFDVSVNKTDRVCTLVLACLDHGVDAEGLIIDTVGRLGYSKAHIAIMLKTEDRRDASSRRWDRDVEGRYILLKKN